eukprot:CAMPEP_0202890046 /NCGR_PEP_ID=MMETSP1392-20130828/566_1 /ASSEMBLY_ACC=CAM_ASM_000868 /TAXON_ID=225041 /ORGANISM="Chlamydomonas chlamydogama, Strain SAG 11-48b" /LENGTH=212 /DNA_ID=CAMNT_0049573527 /DNA_START=118 /DNA_END=758 /DNA_ORIENTATION=+
MPHKDDDDGKDEDLGDEDDDNADDGQHAELDVGHVIGDMGTSNADLSQPVTASNVIASLANANVALAQQVTASNAAILQLAATRDSARVAASVAPQVINIDDLPWFWRTAIKGYLLFMEDIQGLSEHKKQRDALHASCNANIWQWRVAAVLVFLALFGIWTYDVKQELSDVSGFSIVVSVWWAMYSMVNHMAQMALGVPAPKYIPFMLITGV